MKQILLYILCPVMMFGQTQIGQDIDGDEIGERLGNSVSLSSSGTIVAMGAYIESLNTGKVKVYENIENVWTQIGQDIDGEGNNETSIVKISLSSNGNIVAIGAPFNDGNLVNAGHVRIYENVGGVWTQIGQDIDGEAQADHSGSSVSLSANGNIIAIGAPSNDVNGNYSGHVRIYENIGGVWIQVGQNIDGEAALNHTGKSVSLSADGTIVAIGAPDIVNPGYVRVYENIAGVWTKVGQDIVGEAEGDRFGTSVSLSSEGNIVAIGAISNDDNGVNSGHVRIFENIEGNWIQIGQDIDGEAEYDESGIELALSDDGEIVAIGAENNDGINGGATGHVRIYENILGDWTQIGQDIDGEAELDYSGSVSISSNGAIVAIGAHSNNGNGIINSGHVRVYDLSALLSNPEFELSNYIRLFPNPTINILHIKSNNTLTSVEVYNLIGKQIYYATPNALVEEINMSGFNSGMYIVKVKIGEQTSIYKLVKE